MPQTQNHSKKRGHHVMQCFGKPDTARSKSSAGVMLHVSKNAGRSRRCLTVKFVRINGSD